MRSTYSSERETNGFLRETLYRNGGVRNALIVGL
jgi:hypothetical protein